MLVTGARSGPDHTFSSGTYFIVLSKFNISHVERAIAEYVEYTDDLFVTKMFWRKCFGLLAVC